MNNQTQIFNRKWMLALAVPAVAGLIAIGGCDDSTTPADTTGDAVNDMGTAADRTMDNAGTTMDNAMDKGSNTTEGIMGNDSAALANVPQAAIDKLTSMSQEGAEMAERMKDQAEDTADVDGYGTGSARSQKLGSINEAFDALKGGIEDRNFKEVTTALTSLKGMNLTGELKTQLSGIVDAMKSANVPGIDKLMPAM